VFDVIGLDLHTGSAICMDVHAVESFLNLHISARIEKIAGGIETTILKLDPIPQAAHLQSIGDWLFEVLACDPDGIAGARYVSIFRANDATAVAQLLGKKI
jgi:hypothetical protein